MTHFGHHFQKFYKCFCKNRYISVTLGGTVFILPGYLQDIVFMIPTEFCADMSNGSKDIAIMTNFKMADTWFIQSWHVVQPIQGIHRHKDHNFLTDCSKVINENVNFWYLPTHRWRYSPLFWRTSGSGTLCVFGCRSGPGLHFLYDFIPLLDYFWSIFCFVYSTSYCWHFWTVFGLDN